ncbi:DEAD/DEAH box helicase family protein [Nitritalea halalkaliphila]|uniref:hypothetical protein n=1 Tax=Nitritalea halalkaliphila TaxID=590849 RepID=UPI0029347BB1|nr:hypothetical protein [Nitritalea halalkaliphila]
MARFLQRAGRSGHRPGVASEIYFVPTHALELLEAAALRDAIREGEIETLPGPQLTYDVLIQFLLTLAVGGGFRPEELYPCLRQTFAFRQLDPKAYAWILRFITQGGEALQGYAEFSKVQEDGQGRLLIKDKRTAMRHRLSMGTIVSDPMVKVRFKTGGFIGMIEEYFISKLKPGDKFFFAGRSLEFVQLKDMQALVKRSSAKTSNIPSYMGGRISLTSRLSEKIKDTLDEVSRGIYRQEETRYLEPLLRLQQKLSLVPDRQTLLIEHQRTKEGDHIYFYPFEGRMVHEILAALVAYRLSVSMPLTFSIAMNDYGFELLSDAALPIESYLEEDLFRMEGLEEDLAACINESEMAKRKFRDVATIAGLIFQGFPGKTATFKHLQSHSGLLYSVFETYDPDNLLLEQARREVMSVAVSEDQVRAALQRINGKRIMLKRPGQFTPFSFPILVDRLRATLSSESLEDRIVKMRAALIEE